MISGKEKVMADISISPVNVNTTPPPAIRTNVRNANGGDNAGSVRVDRPAASEAAEKVREAAEAQRDRSAEIRREQLEDVIAVSKDGDTVQASEKSIERLEEDAFGHMEVRKDQTASDDATQEIIAQTAETEVEETETQQAIAESREETLMNNTITEDAIKESTQRAVTGTDRTEEAIMAGNERAEREEAEEEYNQKLQTFEGISDMKLEQMYLQGEISKIDYDQEMQSREEAREAENKDNSEFGNQMAGAAVLQEAGERDLQQIETAFSDEANNNNISAADRMEIIETLDAQAANAQAAGGVVTDENASGEEMIKKVVFS